MEGGVAEEGLVGPGALEVDVQVVFPGEADAAVDLHAAVAHLARGVGGVGLGDRDARAASGALAERAQAA